MWKRVLAGATATLTLGAGTTAVLDNRADPYTDKGTHFELPIQSDIPQGERVEIAKHRAAMTMKGWNDEYAITIEPQIPTALLGAAGRPFVSKGNRPLLSKKMEYRSGDVTAFIEPRDNANEFDIDFTLHAKPDTNVFTYKIAGAEDFDFFYQPELTPEEIADGASRPDNVIGSYAVYHKTKANHRIGATNYATGKAFHIYRPKAIDANGEEVWAELSYSDGVLAVTVPGKWLETAAYPVVVDPTFGQTSEGASNETMTDDDARVGLFTLTEDGDVTELAYFATLTQDSQKALIYAHGGTDPSSLLATGSVSSGGTEPFVRPFASPVSLTAADYWIGFVKSTGFNGTFSYDASAGNGRVDGSLTYASPANPWDTAGDTANTNLYSIYATYTASGGAAPADDTYFEVLN